MKIKAQSQAVKERRKRSWGTPFRIGQLTFPHRLVQAPLAGISCSAFRALFSLYEKPAYCVTEMISAKDLIKKKDKNSRYVRRSCHEGVLCYQLSGDDPLQLAEACAYVTSLGAELIDLNMGCPKPKIRQKGAGSKLIEDPENVYRLLSSMRAATDLPLTAKIRTSGHTDDMVFIETADAIQASRIDALIVHTRHWTEDYTVACSYEQCALLVERLSMPIIANGDIHDRGSLERCVRETGADAFMIGRASIGKPWWYAECLQDEIIITAETQLNLFIKHIRALVVDTGSEWLALLAARRLLKHYFSRVFDEQVRERMYQLKTIDDVANYLYEKVQTVKQGS